MENNVNNNIKSAIEYYEEESRYGSVSIAIVVYNSDDDTAMTVTDMKPLEFATSMTTALGSFLKQNNHERQFVQDTIMSLLHRKGVEYNTNFADALPTYNEFTRYIPQGDKSSFDETPREIMERLSKG